MAPFLLGVLVPVAVVAMLALAAILFIRGSASGLETSTRNFLRVYLHLAALVSAVVLVFGLSRAGTGILGALAPDFTYGAPPEAIPAVRGEGPGPPTFAELAPISKPSQEEFNARRTAEHLVQGTTMAGTGLLFLAMHLLARRQIEAAADRASALRRGYHLIGVTIFGAAAIILLPVALGDSLRFLLIPVGRFEFRQGAGEAVASAAAVLAGWLAFLKLVVDDYRSALPTALPPAEVP